MFEFILLGILVISLVVVILCLSDIKKENEGLKEEIRILERTIESKDNSRNRDISNLNQKLSYLKKWDYRQEEEIQHLKNVIKVTCQANENLKEENELLKKKNEELLINQVNEKMDEPCVNENDSNWFKCHCGSEDFIRLSLEEHKGIIGVPPYWEINVQCVKCGGIHKVKNEPYSDKYTHKKSTD